MGIEKDKLIDKTVQCLHHTLVQYKINYLLTEEDATGKSRDASTKSHVSCFEICAVFIGGTTIITV